jgi:septum formation protein
MGQIILASASPRRKELLEQIGLEFEICPAKGEEVISKSAPEEVVMELSEQKATEVAAMVKTYESGHGELMTPQDILVIGADTVVACDDTILGKPKDEEHAYEILLSLQGRAHEVYTGVAILSYNNTGEKEIINHAVETKVHVHEMSEEEIRAYIATGDPMDKAGAYGIQGSFAAYIDGIEGDYYNVVGLPVSYVYQQLKKR